MDDTRKSSGAPSTDYEEIQNYLVGLKNHGVSLGLERMQRLMVALDHPEKRVPCIHVAGTNGKGSVAAMLESILRGTGRRTGLYTSPHLVRLGERVQVNRHPLTEEEMTAYVRELQPVAARIGATAADRPSYFEFMTAMAFVHFARACCNVAVVEVGLGGRLDATNVVEPEVSVITSIGMDHTEFLGDTLEAIAAEKAGIIKSGRPVVIGRMPAMAEAVIRDMATARGALCVSVREEFADDLARYPRTNLAGDYQRWNAATATLAALLLPGAWCVKPEVIQRGLLRVDWPGRWQEICVGSKRVILDASHNAEGAEMLDAHLRQLAAECRRAPVVIIGALGIARAKPLIATICRHAGEIHLVVPDQGRACSHAQLEALVPATYCGRVIRASVANLFPAPAVCTAGRLDDPIVVTGSVYLVGEVMARLEPQRGLLESGLQDF